MEADTLQAVNQGLVKENLGLQHEVVDLNKQIHDMHRMYKALSRGSKKEMEQVRGLFLSKKAQLCGIIN